MAREPEAIGKALSLLEQDSGRGWHVLEGASRPDVYLETPEAIVVIEGKRTEAGPTTHTSWMKTRHQMLRHIDAAWDQRTGRRVFGFFIVEGDDPEGAIPDHWLAVARATTEPEAVARSLPHRTQEERDAIASAFLGVTTWQATCRALDVPWNALPARSVSLERAIQLAAEAHAGQVDKADQPYILHVLRVMLRLEGENERVAAALHDLLEDTSVTAEDLRAEGFAPEVIAAVQALTKREGETYEDFIRRVSTNPIAARVKLADLADNMDLTRIASPTERDRARTEKYHQAIDLLSTLGHEL
jgi:hypothetical protein